MERIPGLVEKIQGFLKIKCKEKWNVYGFVLVG